MREHVRQLIKDARQRDGSSLGTEAVRLARLAAAVHAAQTAQQMAEPPQLRQAAVVQEHSA